jgi:hypothetical protein
MASNLTVYLLVGGLYCVLSGRRQLPALVEIALSGATSGERGLFQQRSDVLYGNVERR